MDLPTAHSYQVDATAFRATNARTGPWRYRRAISWRSHGEMTDGDDTFRALRERAGLSRDQVASALETSSAAVVFRWESGRTVPKTRFIRRLAQLYGVDADTILRSLGF